MQTDFSKQLRANILATVKELSAKHERLSLPTLKLFTPWPSQSLRGAPAGTNVQRAYDELFKEVCERTPAIKKFILPEQQSVAPAAMVAQSAEEQPDIDLASLTPREQQLFIAGMGQMSFLVSAGWEGHRQIQSAVSANAEFSKLIYEYGAENGISPDAPAQSPVAGAGASRDYETAYHTALGILAHYWGDTTTKPNETLQGALRRVGVSEKSLAAAGLLKGGVQAAQGIPDSAIPAAQLNTIIDAAVERALGVKPLGLSDREEEQWLAESRRLADVARKAVSIDAVSTAGILAKGAVLEALDPDFLAKYGRDATPAQVTSLCEAVADFAWMFATSESLPGDSRELPRLCIDWALEFERKHKGEPWGETTESLDYMDTSEKFFAEKYAQWVMGCDDKHENTDIRKGSGDAVSAAPLRQHPLEIEEDMWDMDLHEAAAMGFLNRVCPGRITLESLALLDEDERTVYQIAFENSHLDQIPTALRETFEAAHGYAPKQPIHAIEAVIAQATGKPPHVSPEQSKPQTRKGR